MRTALIALLIFPWMYATADDFTKTYQGKYEVDKGANLVIINKFGDIQCQAWDESSVSIVVAVKVEASSQERADKVFDKINVSLSGSRTKVEGTTSVENINNADFSINYEIHIPRWINLDLDNRFGDIYLDETVGVAVINLEYGAMEANSFNGPKTELTVKFSDAEAGFMKDGNLSIEYSEWESKGAENLRVYSRFTEIAIEKVSMLNLDSQYDEVNIGTAGEVIAVSRFSELEFARINGDFDFDIEYGELDADYISADFKSGKVRNTFAGANLSFDPKSAVAITAELKFGELTYPEAKTSMNEEIIGYTTHIYKGRIGASTSPASQLTIDSKNADVNIDFAE
jgi:hypothetical protein